MLLNAKVTPEALTEARKRTQTAQLTEHMLGNWVSNFITYARAKCPEKRTA